MFVLNWFYDWFYRHRAKKLIFSVVISQNVFKGLNSMILTDEQEVEVSVTPLTAAGNAAKLDGAVIWSSSDDAVVTVVAAEGDSLHATVRTVGPVGVVQIVARGDADLGAGTREIMATLDVEVVAAEAVSVGIVAGAPRIKTV